MTSIPSARYDPQPRSATGLEVVVEVRDSVHGAVALDKREAALVDHPWLQRLRGIGQTGFAHLPFPGATHSRFAHSVGVMHLAGVAFDLVYRDWPWRDPASRPRLRSALRLAALAHDLGHAPFSHCTEFAMPPVADLRCSWIRSSARRATHEDYTLAILEVSDLRQAIDGGGEAQAQHVAALISPEVRVSDGFFHDGGLDHRRLLAQLVSSELDCDRLDYLVRDSLHCGVSYGRVDVDWLLGNLRPHIADGQVGLALEERALYAFDHFLLARLSMFLQVYFHHTSVVYEEMLRAWVTDPSVGWALPSDLEAYLHVDDAAVTATLRASSHPMAQRLVGRRPYRRVAEAHGRHEEAELRSVRDKLEQAGLHYLHSSSSGVVARSSVGAKRNRAAPIFVLPAATGSRGARDLAHASVAIQRFAEARWIGRVYVAPEQRELAQRLLQSS